MFANNGVSLSDIAAVTGRNNGMGGFSDGWWILIILFAMNGGFGNNGYNQGNAGMQADIQRGFDFNEVGNKLNSIGDGICSLGYDQMRQINGVNENIMRGNNALSAQMAQCCCDQREAISQTRYDMASHACDLGHQMTMMGQQIIANDNNNYRMLHDEIFQMRMEDKDATIRRQNDQIHALQLAASQAEQTNQIARMFNNRDNCGCGCDCDCYGWGRHC